MSVYKKDDLDFLLDGLTNFNPDVNIISSGGTARKIKELGYDVTGVSEYTGFPESPGGLVKTLHPKVHGGILMDPERKEEGTYLSTQNILSFDALVCNLYPFQETVESNAGYDEIVEMIDIGGPTLIRSAAKGSLRRGRPVTVVDPGDYESVIDDLNTYKRVRYSKVKELAKKAFRHTEEYDKKINEWLDSL